jgi:hypothetical protein
MDQAIWANSANCVIVVLQLESAGLCLKPICAYSFDNAELLWAPAFAQK